MALCAAAFVPVATCAAVDKAADKPQQYVQLEAPYTVQAAMIDDEPTEQVVTYNVSLEQDLQSFIAAVCEERHIAPAIVFAMIDCESGFQADAVGDDGQSFGLLQIQPRWHYQRMLDLNCTNLLDPKQNVIVGVDILAEQLERYDGDFEKALTAYNQGSYNGTVSEYALTVLEKAGDIRGQISNG